MSQNNEQGFPKWLTQLLIYAVVVVVSGAGGNAWGTRRLVTHTVDGHAVTLQRLQSVEDIIKELATKSDIRRLEERVQSLSNNLEPITAALIRRGVLN